MPATVTGNGSGSESSSGNIILDSPTTSLTYAGDMFVAVIAYRGNAAFTVPAGWTKNEEENTGNTTEETTGSISSVMVATKVLAPGDFPLPEDYTFTRTGGGVATGIIYRLRGVGKTLPIDVSSSFTLAAANTNVSPLPGITTSEDDELLFMVVSLARNCEPTNFVATTPATLTRIAWFGTATGANVDVGIARATKTTAGATGNFGVTAGASARHCAAVIAIKAQLSDTIAPAVVSAAGTVVNPSVRLGSIVIEPNVVAKGTVVNPSIVLGSVVVSPAPASVVGVVVDPLISTSSVSITPAQASASGIVVDPVVKGELVVSSEPADAKSATSLELVEISQGPLFAPEFPITSVWTPQEALS